MSDKTIISHLLEQLQLVQDGRLWMGDHFRKKIASLTEDEAFSRPHPDLHTPAELLAHLLAWRTDAIEKITTGKGTLMEKDPANWPDNDLLKSKGWSTLLADYDQSLRRIKELLHDKTDDFLQEQYEDQDFDGQFSYEFMLNGLLHHDIYHLGQLGIVIKLIKTQAP